MTKSTKRARDKEGNANERGSIKPIAPPLPPPSVNNSGVDVKHLQLQSLVDAWVRTGSLPAALVGVWKHGKEVAYISSHGRDQPAYARDAIFRIYSMTKPVTAVCSLFPLQSLQEKDEKNNPILNLPRRSLTPSFILDSRRCVSFNSPDEAYCHWMTPYPSTFHSLPTYGSSRHSPQSSPRGRPRSKILSSKQVLLFNPNPNPNPGPNSNPYPHPIPLILLT